MKNNNTNNNKHIIYPLKKTFTKEFVDKKGKKIFSITYQQATIAEYHEFFAKNSEEQFAEMYQIIHSQAKLSLFEKIIQFFFPKFPWKIERALDLQKEISEIISNRFRTWKSVFDNGEEKKKQPNWLYSAGISILCEKYNLSPHELFEKYTLEQYSWLMDWIIFIANESSDEWKQKNHLALVDKESIKKRAEETRKAFEEIEQMEQVEKENIKLTL